MGKLLHRLIHGMWPSWLTRIKFSDASTKKLLLPFLRAGNLFSTKSSAASSSSPRSTTNTELLAFTDQNSTYNSQSEDDNQAPTKENNEIKATHSIRSDHLGSKRKSEYQKEADKGRARRIWPLKRMKKEEVMCELHDSLCAMVGSSCAVVKYSDDPHHELWESMVDMIVGNGLWEASNLEFLLYCYLSLNEPHLHQIIEITFLHVLQDLASTTIS